MKEKKVELSKKTLKRIRAVAVKVGMVPIGTPGTGKTHSTFRFANAQKYAQGLMSRFYNKGDGIISFEQSQRYALLHIQLLIELERSRFDSFYNEAETIKWLRQVKEEIYVVKQSEI